MKKLMILSVFIVSFLSCYGQSSRADKLNKTIKVKSQKECKEKNGYWYSNKCWANFKEFDEGISIESIDKEVQEQLSAIKKFGLKIDGKSCNIDFFFPEINYENDELLMIVLFTEEKVTKTLILTTTIKDSEKELFNVEAILFNKNLMELSEDEEEKVQSYIFATGSAKVKSIENNNAQEFDVSGVLHSISGANEIQLNLKVGEALTGIGDTTIEIKGEEVYLNGTLGTKSYAQFKDLIENHPEVKTVVLQNVPGSINDAVNMHTGRIIREAGLNTKVLEDSQISSGGVDIFLAGKKRIVTKGAHIGIHSWGGDGISADELVKDHPAHQYLLEYTTMCLGREKGTVFYFMTIEAASANDMYWMTNEEIKKTISTQFLNN